MDSKSNRFPRVFVECARERELEIIVNLTESELQDIETYCDIVSKQSRKMTVAEYFLALHHRLMDELTVEMPGEEGIALYSDSPRISDGWGHTRAVVQIGMAETEAKKRIQQEDHPITREAMSNDEEWSASEVARRLYQDKKISSEGAAKGRVTRAYKSGRLPSRRDGANVLIPANAAVRWIYEQKVASDKPDDNFEVE